jgi:hypothetical protein
MPRVLKTVEPDGDHIRNFDQAGEPAQPITAMWAAGALQQMFARQGLEQWLQRSTRHTGAFGEFRVADNCFAAAVQGHVQNNCDRYHSTVPARKEHFVDHTPCQLFPHSPSRAW